MMLKLGKTPARPGAIKLKLRDYLDMSKLPAPPAEFGHEHLVSDYGLLGNDQYGDCVWAGAAHETMMWNKEAGKAIAFTDASVLSDYSAVTGFNAGDSSTDQGTDMATAAAYRVKTGVLDASGARHKVGAYLAITAGDVAEHLAASYLFAAVGVGITFPSTAMDQFSAGQPWEVVAGSTIDGGHYVPLVARRGGLMQVLTWGKIQPATDAFFMANNDESIVYLSAEMMTSNGKSIDGFALDQLQSDFKTLQQETAS